MTQQIGIFGYPLSHSISPVIQQAALDYYGLPIRYSAWPTPSGRLKDEVNKLRGGEYLGANVTIPHKERVRSLLDGDDPWAEVVGAVNTIVKEGEELIGHNTDSHGFVRSLKEVSRFEPEGMSVVLIGAGGAARAAAFGLAEEGIASLSIANRTRGRACDLADDLCGVIASTKAIPMNKIAFSEALPGVDLIVNATSIGMLRGESDGETPLTSDLIPSGALVYDMVYNPPETSLMMEAKKAGACTLGGLSMLVFQGAASFELWTGKQAPVEVMFQAAEKAVADVSAKN